MPAQSILCETIEKKKKATCEQTWEFYTNSLRKTNWTLVGFLLHGFHVVLWLQRDLQDFGAIHDLLVAVGGDRLASDSVNLIKSVRLQDALIGCTNKNLEDKWILASVAMQLQTRKTDEAEQFKISTN